MTAQHTILVVDDEVKILDAVSSYLQAKGFKTLMATSGLEALDVFAKHPVDFVILDLMLPDLSGEEVCRRLRATSRVPIIMLTAKSAEDDMLAGLSMGADDYITKPFSLKELLARIEVVMRRASVDTQALASRMSYNDGDLIIDFDTKEVRKAGSVLKMTPKEWRILTTLAKHPHKVFTRDDLIAIAFDVSFDGFDRVIDTHIKNLRNKIEDDSKNPRYIRTIHGMGYKFGGEEL